MLVTLRPAELPMRGSGSTMVGDYGTGIRGSQTLRGEGCTQHNIGSHAVCRLIAVPSTGWVPSIGSAATHNGTEMHAREQTQQQVRYDSKS